MIEANLEPASESEGGQEEGGQDEGSILRSLLRMCKVKR